MKIKIAALFAAIAMTLFAWSSPQAEMITGSNAEKLKNALEWSYWQGHGGRGDGRCIYIIYASWCPHCKKLVREIPKIQERLEARWILYEAAPGSKFILSSVMPKAFADFIGGKKTSDSSLDSVIFTYNKNVLEFFSKMQKLSYPTFCLITNKGVRVVNSFEEALKYENEIAPSTMGPNVTYEALKRYARQDGKALPRGYFNNSGHVQYMRAFPDRRAPAIEKLNKGQGYGDVQECPARNGERWLSIPLWNNYMPLFLMPKE